MSSNIRVNLFPQFEKCIQHYRPPIEALLKIDHSLNNETRSIAVRLLLVSRAAEISIRLLTDRLNTCSKEDALFILDTIAGMDLYRDLLLRLFDRYRYLFELTLDVEGMYSTVWECMIHAQNVEVDVKHTVQNEQSLRRALIDCVCEWARPSEPGSSDTHGQYVHRAWHSYLIAWRWVMMSRQAAIEMMSNRLLYM